MVQQDAQDQFLTVLAQVNATLGQVVEQVSVFILLDMASDLGRTTNISILSRFLLSCLHSLLLLHPISTTFPR
jgi:hypothetical protein